MPNIKVKAVVLTNKDCKEKDKLVTLFSLEEGKLFVYFKGVKLDKAKLKAGKEPFTFGEFVIEKGRAGNIVTEVEIIDSFLPIRADIDKYYEACSILDIVLKLFKDPNPTMFIQVIKSLKAISYDFSPKNYALLKFLLSIFENNGYNLNFDVCSSCKAKLTGKKFLNLDFGEIVCSNCKRNTSVEILPSTMSALKIIKQTPYDKLKSVKIGGGGTEKAVNLLAENFEWRFNCRFFMA